MARRRRPSKELLRETTSEDGEREEEGPSRVEAIVVSSDEEDAGPTHVHENGGDLKEFEDWDPQKVRRLWKKHRGRKGRGASLERVAAYTPRGVPIKWKSLSLLRGCQWLDDELVNGYFELIRRRSCCGRRAATPRLPQVEVFSTFWWTKMSANGTGFDYEGVKKWSQNMNLNEKDMILVPINHSNLHWTLASINLMEGRIDYFDSMKGNGLSGRAGKHVLKILIRFMKRVADEDSRFALPKRFNKRIVKKIPGQNDPGSCGVFTCLYGERLSRGMPPPFDFEQKDIAHLRACMAADILMAELRYSVG